MKGKMNENNNTNNTKPRNTTAEKKISRDHFPLPTATC